MAPDVRQSTCLQKDAGMAPDVGIFIQASAQIGNRQSAILSWPVDFAGG